MRQGGSARPDRIVHRAVNETLTDHQRCLLVAIARNRNPPDAMMSGSGVGAFVLGLSMLPFFFSSGRAVSHGGSVATNESDTSRG